MDMNRSMNEHQLKLSIKDIKNTVPAKIVVLTNKFEHLKSLKEIISFG